MLSLRGFGALIPSILLLTVGSGDGSEIINGKEVAKHSLPFMALVWSSDNKMCGGTLIDPQWVLTAAHCERTAEVWLGVHSRKATNIEKNFRQYRKVIKNVPYPGYKSVTHDNDLRLLKLDRPVTQTKSVRPLKLNFNIRDPKGGTRCLVAGWGDTESGKTSDVLKAVYVSVVDRGRCNSRDYYNSRITENMMCAGSDGQNVADTCQGDSGGPIICNGFQVGATSFGNGCGKIHKPGVYAFLNKKLLSWISKTMKG